MFGGPFESAVASEELVRRRARLLGKMEPQEGGAADCLEKSCSLPPAVNVFSGETAEGNSPAAAGRLVSEDGEKPDLVMLLRSVSPRDRGAALSGSCTIQHPFLCLTPTPSSLTATADEVGGWLLVAEAQDQILFFLAATLG